jgi:hypothetical protein
VTRAAAEDGAVSGQGGLCVVVHRGATRDTQKGNPGGTSRGQAAFRHRQQLQIRCRSHGVYADTLRLSSQRSAMCNPVLFLQLNS